jgi:hypothetical protein
MLKHGHKLVLKKNNEHVLLYISIRSQYRCFHDKQPTIEGGVAGANVARLRGRKVLTYTVVIKAWNEFDTGIAQGQHRP